VYPIRNFVRGIALLGLMSAAAEAALPRAQDLAGTPPFVVGAAEFDGLGAIAQDQAGAVGDVNGDGVADVILGAPGFDGLGREGSGAVFVFFGPVNPSVTIDLGSDQADLVVIGATERARASAGSVLVADLDGDGWMDLLVGSPSAASPAAEPNTGRVDVLYGPLARGAVDLAIGGPRQSTIVGARDRPGGDNWGDLLGGDIAVADVHGTSALDLVVGARACDPGPWDIHRGCVFVLDGPIAPGMLVDLEMAQASVTMLGDFGPNGDQFGDYLAAGDLNDDGRADLVVGNDPISGANRNRAYAFFSPQRDVDLSVESADVEFLNEPWPQGIGVGFAIADLDGDGASDLALGSENATAPGGREETGAVRVFFGPLARGTRIEDLDAQSDLTIFGITGTDDLLHRPGDLFGDWLEAVDVVGDRALDLVVGATGSGIPEGRPGAGAVLVVEGPFARGVIDLAFQAPRSRILGGTADDRVGRALILDATGDGTPDLLVHASFADGPNEGREGCGEAYWVFGDNRPPVADAGGPYLMDCGAGMRVVLDGSRSSDPDEDPLIYAWSTDCAGVRIMAPGSAITELERIAPSESCEATCSVSLVVSDPAGANASDEADVTVVDRTPPAVLRSGSPLAVLWPPNHRMACFAPADLAIEVIDECNAVTWRFTGCASDEPDDGLGDGHSAADCRVDGDRLCVRSERAGRRDGRSYEVLVEAVDACGNASGPIPAGEIVVPHDQARSRGRGRLR